jgi:hypothetical protein
VKDPTKFFKECAGNVKGCITKVLTAPMRLNPITQLAKSQLKNMNNLVGDNNIFSKVVAKAGSVAAKGINKGVGAVFKGDNIISKLGRGLGIGISGTVSGVADVVARPGRAMEAMAALSEDPINGAIAVGKGIAADCKEDAAGCAGNLLFEAASLAFPGLGAAKMAAKIGKIAKLAKLAKAASKAGKLGKFGKAASKMKKLVKGVKSKVRKSKGKTAKKSKGKTASKNVSSAKKNIKKINKQYKKFKKYKKKAEKIKDKLEDAMEGEESEEVDA